MKERSFTKQRAFDIVMSFTGLVLMLPVFLVIGILIKLNSKGPVFYKGKRIGNSGIAFGMYKFRSMLMDVGENDASATPFKNDPRITDIGRFLRATKLDELPQLINVLKGDMSLIGPRPEMDEQVNRVREQKRNEKVFRSLVGRMINARGWAAILILLCFLITYPILASFLPVTFDWRLIFIISLPLMLIQTSRWLSNYRVRREYFGNSEHEIREVIAFILRSAKRGDLDIGGTGLIDLEEFMSDKRVRELIDRPA